MSRMEIVEEMTDNASPKLVLSSSGVCRVVFVERLTSDDVAALRRIVARVVEEIGTPASTMRGRFQRGERGQWGVLVHHKGGAGRFFCESD